jgi:hypothetical protein
MITPLGPVPATEPSSSADYRMWIVELQDGCLCSWSHGISLWVGIGMGDPLNRVSTLFKSRRSQYRQIAQCMVRPRLDLGSTRSYRDRSTATRAKTRVIRKLRDSGNWVNGVGQLRWVYVIELDDDVGSKTGRASMPWLYVGETGIPIDDRIEQHRIAARNARGPLFSRTAHRHFRRPRPDIYEAIPPVHNQADSKSLEASLAKSLRTKGYSGTFG